MPIEAKEPTKNLKICNMKPELHNFDAIKKPATESSNKHSARDLTDENTHSKQVAQTYELSLQHIAANQRGRLADQEILNQLRDVTGCIGTALVKLFGDHLIELSSGRIPKETHTVIREVCESAKSLQASPVRILHDDLAIFGLPLLPKAGATAVVVLLHRSQHQVEETLARATMAASYLRLCHQRDEDQQTEVFQQRLRELLDLNSIVQSEDTFQAACEKAVQRLKAELGCRMVAICERTGDQMFVTSVAGLSQLEPRSSMHQLIVRACREYSRDGEFGARSVTANITDSALASHYQLLQSMRCRFVATQSIISNNFLVAELIWTGDDEDRLEANQRFVDSFVKASGRSLQLLGKQDRLLWIAAARKVANFMVRRSKMVFREED